MAQSPVAPRAKRRPGSALRAHIAIALAIGAFLLCSVGPATAQDTPTSTTPASDSGTPASDSGTPTPGSSTSTPAGSETSGTVDFEACTATDNPPIDLAQALAQGLCPRGGDAKPAPGYLAGVLTLVEKNKAKKPKPLTVTFLPNGDSAISLSDPAKTPVHLPGTSNLVGLQSLPGKLASKEVVSLVFRALLAPGEPVSAVDGTLVVRLGKKTKLVPVMGAVRTFAGVAVDPTSLTMNAEDVTATVTLTGSDLVAFLRSGGTVTPTTTLHNDDGDSFQATLELPSADDVAASGDPNQANATVRLADSSPPAGKYTGKLPISNISAGAPAITVEADAQKSILWATLLVFVGVVIGGILRRLIVIAQRRSLLTATLQQSLDVYAYIHRHVHPNDQDETASWDLDDLLGGPPPYEAADSPTDDRLQGAPGVLASIRGARATTDLDEDADRVLDMVARIQRWLRLEPAAQLLVKAEAEYASMPLQFVKDSKPELLLFGRKDNTQEQHEWADSNTRLESRTLLDAGKREPPDAKAADDLVARLLRQAAWHHHYCEAWKALSVADSTRDAERKRLWELDQALVSNNKTVLTRTAEEQDAFDAKLSAFDVKFTAPHKPNKPGPDGRPEDFTQVDWDASPNLFTGWATLDGRSYGQLTRRAATSARALFWPEFGREFDVLNWRDLFWSLLVAGAASAAYIVPKYGDTWGTTTDLIGAVVAGLIGNVAIDWVALPIFQSLRVRSSTPAAPSTPAAQPAPAAGAAASTSGTAAQT
jgi:hypothetical protein